MDRSRRGRGGAPSYSARHGLLDEALYSVCGDGLGGLWVGTIRRGVHHFRDGHFKPLPLGERFPASVIRSLHPGPHGALWIGTDRGLFLHNGGRLVGYTSDDGLSAGPVRAILQEPGGVTWVGTEGGGLSRLEQGRFRRYGQVDGLPSDQVRVLHRSPNGDLWVGSYGGLSQLRDGKIVTTYSTANGLSSNVVRSIHEDADGALWIGTFGGGLNRLRGGRVDSYSVRDGLFSDTIHQILEDDGQFWMSSNKGIFRASKSELDAFSSGQVRRIGSAAYTEADGMLSRECNSGTPGGFKTEDGRLWFPTLRGLVMINPRALAADVAAPPVVLEGVVADGRSYDLSGPAGFPPGTQRLEFHYSGLRLLAPESIRFRYRLDGFDRDWVEAGQQRSAFYTNVPPGRFRFRVVAGTQEGRWGQQEAAFSFSMKPHFYETRPFYGFVTLAALFAVGGAHRLRVGQMRMKERELQRRVEEAMASVKVLRGLLPICAWCKKVRDDDGYWSQIESYVSSRSQAEFTHGICPDCLRARYREIAMHRAPGG